MFISELRIVWTEVYTNEQCFKDVSHLLITKRPRSSQSCTNGQSHLVTSLFRRFLNSRAMCSGLGPCSIRNTSLSSVSSSGVAKLIVVDKCSAPCGAYRKYASKRHSKTVISPDMTEEEQHLLFRLCSLCRTEKRSADLQWWLRQSQFGL